MKIMTFANLHEFPDPKSLIKGLLAELSQGLIYGKPKAGKSFIALDIGLHIAAGADWGKFKVPSQKKVAYVLLEGEAGFKNRMAALRLAKPELVEKAMENFSCVLDTNLNLQEENSVTNLINDLGSIRPDLVIIDTLARSAPSMKENASEDMGLAIEAFKTISIALDTAVMGVHHTPKNGNDPRGHNSLTAAIDTGIRVSNNAISVDYQKDFETLGVFSGFDLEAIRLGNDVDGDPITSCVVNLTEVKPQPNSTRQAQDDLQKIASDTVLQLCHQELKKPGDQISKNQLVKLLRALRPEFTEMGNGTIRIYQSKAFKNLELHNFITNHRNVIKGQL